MNLAEKIQKIETLIERASSEGERQAAVLAKGRLQGRVEEMPIEYRVRSGSIWEKKLFRAICLKNKLSPYRYSRQRNTTTMVQVSKSVMDNILWPEYEKYADFLREMVHEIADELIKKIYQGDDEETVISGEITFEECSNCASS